MEDKISYGVFWCTEDRPFEWRLFSAWFTNYDSAREEANLAINNPRCIAVKIMERTESFIDVYMQTKENNDGEECT